MKKNIVKIFASLVLAVAGAASLFAYSETSLVNKLSFFKTQRDENGQRYPISWETEDLGGYKLKLDFWAGIIDESLGSLTAEKKWTKEGKITLENGYGGKFVFKKQNKDENAISRLEITREYEKKNDAGYNFQDYWDVFCTFNDKEQKINLTTTQAKISELVKPYNSTMFWDYELLDENNWWKEFNDEYKLAISKKDFVEKYIKIYDGEYKVSFEWDDKGDYLLLKGGKNNQTLKFRPID